MKNAFRTLVSLLVVQSITCAETFQATGVKVGEVSDTSAIVWVRVTQSSERNSVGFLVKGRPLSQDSDPLPPGVRVEDLEGSCPGAEGRVLLSYGPVGEASLQILEGKSMELLSLESTEWTAVAAERDFTHQFILENLTPYTTYSYHIGADRGEEGGQGTGIAGFFRTAPRRADSMPVTFTVITGQMYQDTDRPDGFQIYESMRDLNPNFIVLTGDTVYYDNEKPRATTIELARYHWHRMYSFPTLRNFHLRVPGYWMKDDHDTLSNDCWPTLNPDFMLPLTFEDGQRIFREQVPMGEKTHRTFRWGKHLQVWLPEGRDFRSPNNDPDGPGKTIWGEEQKRWLAESILASDADWKILVSATPIVGPDRGNKADNHANQAFAWEGNQVRRWIAQNCPDNLFVVCGDRHWQYESIDPETQVHEFSCGPASDQHAGGIPEDSTDEYKWFRVMGGFLSVSATPEEGGSQIAFRHHDVNGKIVNEFLKSSKDGKQSSP